ncbi:diphthamide synthase subunit DPH2, partial [mine drainage metagenome]
MAANGSPGPDPRVFPSIGPKLLEAVRDVGAQRILLQVPAGLVRNAHDLAAEIARHSGARVSVSVRPCFGACDLPSAAEAGGSDLVISLGHAPIPNVRLERPTFFVEMRDPRGDPERLAGIVAAGGLPRRLGLVFSIQHLDLAASLPAALDRLGYSGVIGTGDRRLAYPGQALGCNY